MKTISNTIIIIVLALTSVFAQKKDNVISELKNNGVLIKLHKLVEFNDSNSKSDNKFLIADITIENNSNNSVDMGAEYTMGIMLKDAAGNEYRSGLKGAGIVSTYLAKHGSNQQDQKAYNLSFSSNFPAKTKARSLLCGFELPKNTKIVSFGIKKKSLWDAIKK